MGQVFDLKRADLPALYRAASDESAAGQRAFQISTLAGLALLIVAALAGLGTVKVRNIDWAGVIAAVAFFTAFIVRTFRLITQPDKVWYDGRAVAESGKTLGWRYAVGGEPFGIPAESADKATKQAADQATDKLMADRLNDVLGAIHHLQLEPASDGAEQISSAMRELRARPLEDRKATYAVGRIAAQQQWYASKAKENKRLARLWNAILAQHRDHRWFRCNSQSYWRAASGLAGAVWHGGGSRRLVVASQTVCDPGADVFHHLT